MISNNYSQNYSTEPVQLTLPLHFANGGLIPEPLEVELRDRLHDIVEEWEDRALEAQHPTLKKLIRDMIDQIDDAMYPPEED